MKIVIDIDEEYYSYLRRVVFTDRIFYRPVAIIAKGKPLPKRHGRLIDEDILHGRLRDSYLDSFGLMRVKKVLKNMDAVIEADGGDAE